MGKPKVIESPLIEKAVLVGLQLPRQKTWEIEYSLNELEQLVSTAGAETIAKVYQAKDSPHPRTFIGPGKAEEINGILADAEHGMVVFDDELTPSQQLNLEEIINHKIVDRTGLILDIFAQHAHSSEGKVQVELAQLNYYLPRLKGLGIEMSRLGGGIGTRGPGETKLETDRRRIRQRIQQLSSELNQLSKIKELQRQQRKSTGAFGISLVGYTNAGKSSLLNKLTNAGVVVEDKLFATLDSTSRKLRLASGKDVIISDTVGFINKLPHELVAAFKSTLQEVKHAHLLLHVIDAADPHKERQIQAVNKILAELSSQEKPRINVYNKSDLLDEIEKRSLNQEKDSLALSAVTGEGFDVLFELIDRIVSREFELLELYIPYKDASVRQKVYELGVVLSEKSGEGGSFLVAELKAKEAKKMEPYRVDLQKEKKKTPGETNKL